MEKTIETKSGSSRRSIKFTNLQKYSKIKRKKAQITNIKNDIEPTNTDPQTSKR